MKRNIYLTFAAVATAGVGSYAGIASGHVSASVLVLALSALALFWAVWVLFRAVAALVAEPEPLERAERTGRRRKELEREKQALIKALKELEFDHQMGKVSERDFREISGTYRSRVVRVMRQLDAGEFDYRTLVERDLKARRAQGAQAAPSDERPVEKAAATAKRPVCAGCQTQNDADADFCKKCGARLSAARAVP